MKTVLFLMTLLLSVAAAQAQDQEGPSFDCRFAGTATERAICDSPRLSRLERTLVRAYDGLAVRIGEREARALADRHLLLRQACDGEAACIESRMAAATQVFESEGLNGSEGPGPAQGTDDASRSVAEVAAALRAREAGLDDEGSVGMSLVGLDRVLRPRGRPAGGALVPDAGRDGSAPLLAPDRDSLADMTGDGDLDPTPSGPTDGPDLLAAAASPDPDALPGMDAVSPSALTGAFVALPVDRRMTLQARLVEAGFGRLDPDGAWTVATAAALATVTAESRRYGQVFNPSTDEGAAALLDFIDSDGFVQDFLGGEFASDPGR